MTATKKETLVGGPLCGTEVAAGDVEQLRIQARPVGAGECRMWAISIGLSGTSCLYVRGKDGYLAYVPQKGGA